jgi:hypothetical protein
MPDRYGTVMPRRHQAPLPLDRLILTDPPDAEAVPMDVLFVGGGPAGLAGAISLARLIKADNEAGGDLGDVQIGVL